MLNGTVATTSKSDTCQKLTQLLDVIRRDEDILIKLEKKQDRIAYIRFLASLQDIKLTDRQISTILDKADATADQILSQQQTRSTDPKVKLAVQLSLALAAIYYTPGIFATVAANTILRSLLDTCLGPQYGGYGGYAISIANMLGHYYYPDYTPRGLMNYYLPLYVEEYGPIVYTAAPAGVFLYQRGKNILGGIGNALLKCAHLEEPSEEESVVQQTPEKRTLT